MKEQENQQTAAYEKKAVCRKAVCIIGGESRGIRISSRNNGKIKKTTRLVLYKTLHYFCTKLASFGLHGSRNVISTKTLFFYFEEITTNFSYEIQNPKHYFQCKYEIQNPNIIFNSRKLLQISVTKFKTIDVILMCLEILLHKHKAVIKVPGIAKQTVNRK